MINTRAKKDNSTRDSFAPFIKIYPKSHRKFKPDVIPSTESPNQELGFQTLCLSSFFINRDHFFKVLQIIIPSFFIWKIFSSWFLFNPSWIQIFKRTDYIFSKIDFTRSLSRKKNKFLLNQCSKIKLKPQNPSILLFDLSFTSSRPLLKAFSNWEDSVKRINNALYIILRNNEVDISD